MTTPQVHSVNGDGACFQIEAFLEDTVVMVLKYGKVQAGDLDDRTQWTILLGMQIILQANI